MFGALLRCPKCNRYKPDRCICNAQPAPANTSDSDSNNQLELPLDDLAATQVGDTDAGPFGIRSMEEK